MATFNVDGQTILDLVGRRAIPSQVTSSSTEVML
jgi:hypothetical protein